MMTARITSGQVMQFKKLVGDALIALNLTKDQAQRILARGGVFIARLKELILTLAAEYFILLSDDEAIAWMVKFGKREESEACQIVKGFRRKARARGISDKVKIHAEVLPGGLFKRDIPKMCPCVRDFLYLQDWEFQDPATKHVLISWIPAPLPNSTGKNEAEQMKMIAKFKTEAGLPAGYEVSCGSVHHVSGMAFAHYGTVAQCL